MSSHSQSKLPKPFVTSVRPGTDSQVLTIVTTEFSQTCLLDMSSHSQSKLPKPFVTSVRPGTDSHVLTIVTTEFSQCCRQKFLSSSSIDTETSLKRFQIAGSARCIFNSRPLEALVLYHAWLNCTGFHQ